MRDVFRRNYSEEELRKKPIADYTAQEVVAYLLYEYPRDPKGALKNLMSNYDIGYIVGTQAKLLLEGLN